jgi:hypothetical protein
VRQQIMKVLSDAGLTVESIHFTEAELKDYVKAASAAEKPVPPLPKKAKAPTSQSTAADHLNDGGVNEPPPSIPATASGLNLSSILFRDLTCYEQFDKDLQRPKVFIACCHFLEP